MPCPPKPWEVDPVGRTVNILKHDLQSLYKKDLKPLLEFSSHVDYLIVGGGIVGSCLAYMISERCAIRPSGLKLMIIEKDPTVS